MRRLLLIGAVLLAGAGGYYLHDASGSSPAKPKAHSTGIFCGEHSIFGPEHDQELREENGCE